MATQSATVLLTCVGGPFSMDTVQALRLDRDLDLRIVGVDGDPTIAGCFFADSYHSVPMASRDPAAFIDRMLEICRDESVDIVIPGADEEVFALADAKARFEAKGIVAAVEDAEKVALVRDKVKFLTRLRSAGVPLPPFAEVTRLEDLAPVAESLGYPDKRLILKPRTGRGARGLIVVEPAARDLDRGAESRGYVVGNLADVSTLIETMPEPLGLMAMEFFPGDLWDVDCVARQGTALCIVPRRRIWDTPFSRGSEGHRVERSPIIEDVVRQIAREMAYSYAFDCDFGTAADGSPGLLEVNPRWSGSVAASLAGGVNVPSILVRSILGMPIPPVDVRPGGTAIPKTRLVYPGLPAYTVDGMSAE